MPYATESGGTSAAIEACREQSPARYLSIIASLMPKEPLVEKGRPLSNVSDEDLVAIIELVKGDVGQAEQFESENASGSE